MNIDDDIMREAWRLQAIARDHTDRAQARSIALALQAKRDSYKAAEQRCEALLGRDVLSAEKHLAFWREAAEATGERRLQAEQLRSEMERLAEARQKMWFQAEDRCEKLEAERDEAQRVARVLGLWLRYVTKVPAPVLAAVQTALAYPKHKPEPREPSDESLRL